METTASEIFSDSEHQSSVDSKSLKLRKPRSKALKFHKTTTVLSNFCKKKIQKRNKNIEYSGEPKKEYLRCKLIRGLKKSIRLVQIGAVSKNFQYLNETALSKWSSFALFTNQQSDQFFSLASTKVTVQGSKIKSYNQNYCQYFFSVPEIRSSYHYYTEFLFTDLDPKRLCKEFKFQCCINSEHSLACSMLWNKMKNYIQNDILEELGFIPEYSTQEEIAEINTENEEIHEEPCSKPEDIEKRLAFQSIIQFCDQPKWVQSMYLRKFNII